MQITQEKLSKEQRFKIQVGVYALLFRGTQLLNIERTNTGFFDGCFSLPSGSVEKNEKLTDAVAREAKEELGIRIAAESLDLVHIMHRLKSKEDQRLDVFYTCSEFAFMNTILKCGANEQQMNMAHGLLEKIQIDTNCNRSVQGTQNQMVQYAKHMVFYDDIDITQITGHRLGAYLADTPCTVKGRKDTVWPKDEMLALLS